MLAARRSLQLSTRALNYIENILDEIPPTDGGIAEADAFRTDFRTAVHRPGPPSARYNCHGLTFAARRTRIWQDESIEQILTEDGYAQVQQADVIVGDLILYLKDGAPDHSGLVVEIGDAASGGIRVLSKWGEAHEVVHWINECPYKDCSKVFYRLLV